MSTPSESIVSQFLHVQSLDYLGKPKPEWVNPAHIVRISLSEKGSWLHLADGHRMQVAERPEDLGLVLSYAYLTSVAA